MIRSVFEGDHLARRFVLDQWLNEHSSHLDDLTLNEPSGKMFGILIGEMNSQKCGDVSSFHQNQDLEALAVPLTISQSRHYGKERLFVLKAFSGQLNGVWTRPSWAPSLLKHTVIAGESWRVQRALHNLTYKINTLKSDQPPSDIEHSQVHAEIRRLKERRTKLSRSHADTIRAHTYLTAPSGEVVSLESIWPDASTGVGECCAPKLISLAYRLGLSPLGIAEFWWGPPPQKPPAAELESAHVHTRAQERLTFYAPCERRCKPLLSRLLQH